MGKAGEQYPAFSIIFAGKTSRRGLQNIFHILTEDLHKAASLNATQIHLLPGGRGIIPFISWPPTIAFYDAQTLAAGHPMALSGGKTHNIIRLKGK